MLPYAEHSALQSFGAVPAPPLPPEPAAELPAEPPAAGAPAATLPAEPAAPPPTVPPFEEEPPTEAELPPTPAAVPPVPPLPAAACPVFVVDVSPPQATKTEATVAITKNARIAVTKPNWRCECCSSGEIRCPSLLVP
jgi:hypothetical protein